MTEHDWLTSTDVSAMLEAVRGRASERKLRLFAVACCRRVWHLLVEEPCRVAVEVAERLADGQVGQQEVDDINTLAVASSQRWDSEGWGSRDQEAKWSAMQASALALGDMPALRTAHLQAARGAGFDAGTAIEDAVKQALHRFSQSKGTPGRQEALVKWAEVCERANAIETAATAQEVIEQCRVLRDVLGNPYRPLAPDRSLLTSTAVTLARQMYDTRDFSSAPVLADALQDAGCDDALMLEHLRGEGGHWRGCWVVDAVLGKE